MHLRCMSRDHPLLPFAATAAGIALFSLMDALMKGASLAVGAYDALLFRALIGTLLMWPLWKHGGTAWPDRARMRMHALRGAVTAGMALLFFDSLTRLPIAEAIALSFIAPLIALYLAAAMLGEKVGSRALLASLLGFGGVVVIAAGRIDGGNWDGRAIIGIAEVLGSAVLYAWNLVLQRRIAQIADPREIALGQNMTTALVLLVPAPWLAAVPAVATLGPIAAAAALASASLLLISWAYARAETQVLVPIEYSAFLWAMLFGWLFFGETVGAATQAGAVLIVIGCWIAAPKPTEQTAL
jgi:S-adenosylmethionine uptake transporter